MRLIDPMTQASYNYEDPTPHPPSAAYVMRASWLLFFLYFCVLREENDIDEKMFQPLWKTVPELEIPLFEAAVMSHRQMNLPVQDLEAHLKQALLKREKEKTTGAASTN